MYISCHKCIHSKVLFLCRKMLNYLKRNERTGKVLKKKLWKSSRKKKLVEKQPKSMLFPPLKRRVIYL